MVNVRNKDFFLTVQREGAGCGSVSTADVEPALSQDTERCEMLSVWLAASTHSALTLPDGILSSQTVRQEV